MTADVIRPSPEPSKEPQGSRYSALIQGKLLILISWLCANGARSQPSPQRARRDCQHRALAKVRSPPRPKARHRASKIESSSALGVALCLFCPAHFSYDHKHQKLSAPKKRPPDGLVRARAPTKPGAGALGHVPERRRCPEMEKGGNKKKKKKKGGRVPAAGATSRSQPEIAGEPLNRGAQEGSGEGRQGIGQTSPSGPTKTNQTKMFGAAPAVYW